jgi:cell filamentation protein
MKYQTPSNQSEILPNLLNLQLAEEIALAEFEGFLKAEILLTENLSSVTNFNLKYIRQIHELSLGHLYPFAGKYRDVNLSKGGFAFAAARFLPETMKVFEDEILLNLQNTYPDKPSLIKHIALVHAEFLLIHPFREGNGRTARILTNLMSRKQGFGSLLFDKVGEKEFQFYISAVQMAAKKDYQRMEEFMESIFPN